MNSIFEKLQHALGCEYLSDIKIENNLKILQILNKMPLTDYNLAELSDLTEYISEERITFTDHVQAKDYFKDQLYQLRS